MGDLIISVSGLRGPVGESLTPAVAMRYAGALTAVVPSGPIVVTRDGRESGPMLVAAVESGLVALGREVINAGVAATPTTGVLVRHLHAAGGVQITASHNPPPDNGLKLFSSEGRVISSELGARVLETFRHAESLAAPANQLGRVSRCADTTTEHLSLVEKIIDVERVRGCRFRVLLDSNHGSGSLLGRRLLDELGCDLVLVGGEPDGRFEHLPEPTAENLSSVLAQVHNSGSDVGFCQDPDADRLAVVDETGHYIGEEYTLALCVQHVLESRPGPIVINCSTSRMSEDIAQRFGVPCFRSAVGEANVVDAMLRHGAVFGGEGNGGVIDPRVGLVRDSFVGMALILDALASRRQKISQWAAELPRYEIVKTKLSVPRERMADALRAIEQHFSDAASDRLDGLRLDWPGRWLLVRASNTEPIVRTIAEAQTAAEAQRLCDEANRLMRQVVG